MWRRFRYALTPQWDIYNSIAPQVAGLEVLEIGFCTGAGTVVLAGRAESVRGLEIDADAVDFARHSFPLRNVQWLKYDIVPDDGFGPSYDAGVMVEVLEHIPDRYRALKNMHALLRPGGKLYITAKNTNADLRRNDLHLHEVNAAEFRSELLEHFSSVTLYDYTLTNAQGDDSHVTPLVAVAVK